MNTPPDVPMNVPTKSILDLQFVAMQTMMVAYVEALQFWPRVAQAQLRQWWSFAPERRAHSGTGRRRSSMTMHEFGKSEHDSAPPHSP